MPNSYAYVWMHKNMCTYVWKYSDNTRVKYPGLSLVNHKIIRKVISQHYVNTIGLLCKS